MFGIEVRNMIDKNSLVVNGVEYVRKDSILPVSVNAKSLKGKPYVIVRTYSAGVFAGYLDKRVGKEATILNARRIWYWEGAASLSQLAIEGTNKPEKCKFAMPVDKLEVMEAIEVIEASEKARLSIEGVAQWKT
jgi:hypothetical protein